jgi:hypothetical protein
VGVLCYIVVLHVILHELVEERGNDPRRQGCKPRVRPIRLPRISSVLFTIKHDPCSGVVDWFCGPKTAKLVPNTGYDPVSFDYQSNALPIELIGHCLAPGVGIEPTMTFVGRLTAACITSLRIPELIFSSSFTVLWNELWQ